jgi:DNA-binding NarL/FixJ family response regulator
MAETIRVLVADDTDIAREGMQRILARETDIVVVGEGTTASGTVQKVRGLRPDVLLLDLKWFGDEGAGIDTIRQLTREVPETRIIAITMYPDLIERAKSAGARSALTKDVPTRQLIEEIRGVYKMPPLPPAPLVAPAAAVTSDELTEREREVLALVAEGKRDKQIAAILGIGESTAKNHVSNILSKLMVQNRTEAAAKGYALGLIGPRKR